MDYNKVPAGLCARLTLRSDNMLRADLDNDETATGDVGAIVDFLAQHSVQPEYVTMPDWREGDHAPTSGQKIALLHKLRERYSK